MVGTRERLEALMDQVIRVSRDGLPDGMKDRVVVRFLDRMEQARDFDLVWELVPQQTKMFIVTRLYEGRLSSLPPAAAPTPERSGSASGSASGRETYRWPQKSTPAPTAKPSATGERTAQQFEARVANAKAVLNRFFVIEIGKGLGDCTFGDIRQAHAGSRRRTAFYDLILTGREGLADEMPIVDNVSVDEFNQFEQLAKAA